MKHIKYISTEVKEGDPLEERIKVIEEKLNILNEKFNDFLDQHAVVPSTPEKPESPSGPDPVEYDYDDWYSNHGQGD